MPSRTRFESHASGFGFAPRRPDLSRREFLARTALAAAATAFCGQPTLTSFGAEFGRDALNPVPIVVFSKIYQELDLGFGDAAALTAEAGLNGIDCPVRPRGEVLPERVTEDLPRYAEELRKHHLQLPLLTTAITSVSSPHAEAILRTGKQLGAQFYRLGFANPRKEVSVEQQVREIKAQLKELAALNKEIGIGALFQNHSPAGSTTYIGGNLAQLREIVSEFDPAQIGVAFDIGHAVIVHGDAWRTHFEQLKSHLKIAYIKDATRAGRWVPFGQGDIGPSGYFQQLKQLNYQAPFSLHIEFDWSDKGASKTRAQLVKTLQESSRALRRWVAEAA